MFLMPPLAPSSRFKNNNDASKDLIEDMVNAMHSSRSPTDLGICQHN